MSDHTCGVNDGRGVCGQAAVALMTQKTLESKGQPSKTIETYLCEGHAKRMERTGGSHTITRF